MKSINKPINNKLKKKNKELKKSLIDLTEQINEKNKTIEEFNKEGQRLRNYLNSNDKIQKDQNDRLIAYRYLSLAQVSIQNAFLENKPELIDQAMEQALIGLRQLPIIKRSIENHINQLTQAMTNSINENQEKLKEGVKAGEFDVELRPITISYTKKDYKWISKVKRNKK